MSLLGTLARAVLPKGAKPRLKAWHFACKSVIVRLGWSYTASELKKKLAAMGLHSGDCVVMHVAFDEQNGFVGGPVDLINSILEILGPEGHLIMMSMPYLGTSRAYLAENKPFDVRKSPSHMGLVTEAFRRRRGVRRSEHPLHPVLAFGPRSAWLTAGHAELAHSCGSGSPFEKMLELDAKALLVDVGIATLTFTHYLEDFWQGMSSVPLYPTSPVRTQILDAEGVSRAIDVYPFSAEAVAKRDFASLFEAFERERKMRFDRIGNTRLATLSLRDLFDVSRKLVESGHPLHNSMWTSPRIDPHRGHRLLLPLKRAAEEIRSGRVTEDLARIWRKVLRR
jgi:aminoglycoside 3-N-acetyltransferase